MKNHDLSTKDILVKLSERLSTSIEKLNVVLDSIKETKK